MTLLDQSMQPECIARFLVEDEVIQLTYAQWAAEIAQDADGSAAVMADDYTEFIADGETEPLLAKSTRVYVKQNGSWKLVHANFAPLSGNE